jgi:aminoglycoside phosphotransferase (APT) family kinase protein
MSAIDDSRVPTLVHGDCHGRNLFFEADRAPGFRDWQCTFPGAPAHDLAELLLTSLEVDDRRRGEQLIIGHCRAALVAT